MLRNCERKSQRVLSLGFHPTRPWIIAGLESGEIHMVDYRHMDLIYSLSAHEGEVCGIDFHNSKELFVSGGKDTKIHGWNSETQSLIFTLLGHEDTIRTVQFHYEHPWIVSASDDKTIRIWNWESKTCMSILTGHKNHVNCASFHPKEDLVVSASLDKTVRVWDIVALRKKHIVSLAHVVSRTGQMYTDFFNGSDVVVIEGHTAGVNWASFHPTLPLIVSGADDHQVKLWCMKDETRTMDRWRPHINNVSCVMFQPKKPDIIVSTSKDKSIRVWDTTNRTEFRSFHRERDGYCSLAVHPEMNLLAAGHDSGMMVFKLPRERPTFALSFDFLFYFKDSFLWLYEFSTKTGSRLFPIPLPSNLSYSRVDNAVLVFSDLDGGSYELYILPRNDMSFVQERKRGTAASAVIVARSLFAVLEKSSNRVSVRNMDNEEVLTTTLPMPANAIFYAGTGILLCRSEGKVFIHDLQKDLVLGELETPDIVRYIVWSSDKESVALLSKHTIIIASKNLVRRYTLDETTHVKSGAWDDNGVFLYTTLNRIKYCRPDGSSGILRTLDVPIYITKVSGNTIFCLSRDVESMIITIGDEKYSRLVLGENDDDDGNGWEYYDFDDNDDEVADDNDEWVFGCIDVEGILQMESYAGIDEPDEFDLEAWGLLDLEIFIPPRPINPRVSVRLRGGSEISILK